jgi:hypothetical protein
VIHLNLPVITLALLRVFGRHMKVHVAEEPPSGKAATKINATPEPTPVRGTVDGKPSVGFFTNGLEDAKRMSVNLERPRLTQPIKRTRAVPVLHPVHVDAFIVIGTAPDRPVASQVNGTLVVLPTTVVGAPIAMIVDHFPPIGIFPSVRPAGLF